MKNIVNIIYFIVLFYAVCIWGSVCFLTENNSEDDLDTFFDIEISEIKESCISDFVFDDAKIIANRRCGNDAYLDVYISYIQVGSRRFEKGCYLLKNIILFQADTSPPIVVA